MTPADRVATARDILTNNAAALQQAQRVGWAWAVDLFTRERADLLAAFAVDLADVAVVCTGCGWVVPLAEDGPSTGSPVDSPHGRTPE